MKEEDEGPKDEPMKLKSRSKLALVNVAPRGMWLCISANDGETLTLSSSSGPPNLAHWMSTWGLARASTQWARVRMRRRNSGLSTRCLGTSPSISAGLQGSLSKPSGPANAMLAMRPRQTCSHAHFSPSVQPPAGPGWTKSIGQASSPGIEKARSRVCAIEGGARVTVVKSKLAMKVRIGLFLSSRYPSLEGWHGCALMHREE